MLTSSSSTATNKCTEQRPRFVDRWSPEKIQLWLKDDIDGFVFDCDGVLWEGKKEIPNSNLLLHQLVAMGKKMVFVTNNATKSASEFIHKFQSFNMPLPRSEERV